MSRRSGLFLLIMVASRLLTGCAALTLDEVRGDLPIEHKTRLMLAAGAGDRVAVEQALAIGEPVNAKSEERWTPLHFAVMSGSTDVIELLLGRGADINAMSDYLWTPLHVGVEQGKTPVVQVLVEHGADLDIRNAQGATPMHLAARMGRDDYVALLATHGATVQPASSDPEDAFTTAVEYRAVGRVQSQRGDRARGSESYHLAAEHFEKASEGYRLAADKLRSRAFRVKVAGWTKVVVLELAEGLSAAGAQYQAGMQAQQLGQVAALSKAGSMPEYYRLAKAARVQSSPGHVIGSASSTQPDLGAAFDDFEQKATSLEELAANFDAAAKDSAAAAADCRKEGGCS